jgi:hypothetical protein
MADLYCTRCGETWEMDYINFDMTPQERNAFRAGEWCPACKDRKRCVKDVNCCDCEEYDRSEGGCKLNQFKRPFRAELADALGGILGDDLDGLAAEMEDAEYLLGSEFNQ